MHGGLPFIGISIIVYGAIGLTALAAAGFRKLGGVGHVQRHSHRPSS
ncbi:hypothetical protein [Streptomyces ochraceiscleroticus]|uniref:Uncharacterized protein n=1 Tax=Streptomyces ochraceiscleroticus TaxID=47761 RepID=A0ABW1MST5_9ACTN|nr:hypothetical protein [Streptomyces ochraceiscleroticus]